MDFGRSNDFLVVHGDRESYDDDNPPRSNWNIKDYQLCKPWPLSGCPLYCDRYLVMSASTYKRRSCGDGGADRPLTSTLSLRLPGYVKTKTISPVVRKKKRPNIPVGRYFMSLLYVLEDTSGMLILFTPLQLT